MRVVTRTLKHCISEHQRAYAFQNGDVAASALAEHMHVGPQAMMVLTRPRQKSLTATPSSPHGASLNAGVHIQRHPNTEPGQRNAV